MGVGNYTKATLLALTRADPELKIRVMAEILEEKEEYVENKVTVSRVWKRGNPLSLITLFSQVLKDSTKVILMPFEMFMFGSFLSLLVALPMFFILKIRGKRIVLILHQVLEDDVSAFETSKAKAFLIQKILRKPFYLYLQLIATRVIVFEDEFKERLGGSGKVMVIPHAVMSEHIIDQNQAKEKLGLEKDKKYVLFFGYLSPYKGVDRLLIAWEDIPEVKLILGGGGNPNHKHIKLYQDYLNRVLELARAKNVITTGFIPQDMMPYYFCAADLVVLPLVVFMSSSGPLSHAFSYGDGVLLSNALRGYFNSSDMKNALDESNISIDEICFDVDKPLRSKILWAMHNLDKLKAFSVRMRERRNWDKLSNSYLKVIKELDQ